jgi:hypothetical protein
MEIVTYIGIGLVVGAVSGAMGIGGGVILVPALMWLRGYDAPKATGTSLAILALPIALPAALQAYRKSQVEFEPIVWIAAAFMLGAFATRSTIDYLPVATLRFLFGLLMIYIAIRFILASDSEAANAAAGLIGVAVAWIGYWFLRGLGRQHLAQPQLGDEIRRMQQEGRGDPDYYI